MALSADAIRKSRGTPTGKQRLAIATGSTVYIGSLVCYRTTDSRALAGTAATGRKTAGVAIAFDGTDADGVGDTAGNEYVWVEYGNEHLFTLKTAIRTDTTVGVNLFIADDDEMGGTAVGTAGVRVPVGECRQLEGSTQAWVAVRDFASANIAV